MIPVAAYLGLLYFGSEIVLGLVRRAKAGASSPADRGSTRVLWFVITPTIFVAYQFEFGERDEVF